MVFSQFAAGSRIELSLLEMQDISQKINREYGPRIVKRNAVTSKTVLFSHQELQAISQEISREFNQHKPDAAGNLVLLPIDPRRLHVYWHLPVNKPKIDRSVEAIKEKLTLRIFKRENTPSQVKLLDYQPGWLDVAIDPAKNSQQVLLPVDMSNTRTYSASIGSIDDNQVFSSIADSNISHLPSSALSTGKNVTQSPVVSQFMSAGPLGSSANDKNTDPENQRL